MEPNKKPDDVNRRKHGRRRGTEINKSEIDSHDSEEKNRSDSHDSEEKHKRNSHENKNLKKHR